MENSKSRLLKRNKQPLENQLEMRSQHTLNPSKALHLQHYNIHHTSIIPSLSYKT